MTNYNEIKGASELVKKYEATYKVINNSIAELEKQKVELESGLDNSENQFTLESIEKNSKTKQRLNMINQYLKEAKSKKAELDKQTTNESYDKVKTILADNLKENAGKHDDINKQIIENLYKSRFLYRELLKLNAEENERVKAFIEDMSPFFVDIDTFRQHHAGQAPYDLLQSETMKGRTLRFNTVPQPAYYVSGLLKPAIENRDMTKPYGTMDEYNKMFGVDVAEQERKVLASLNKDLGV